MRKKWEYQKFGGKNKDQVFVTSHVVIDNRMRGKDGKAISVAFGSTTNRLEFGGNTWAPLCILPVTDRFTTEELEEYAKIICDRLNVAWVEDALKGDEK